MILSFFLIALITIAGLAVTYVADDESPLLWRLAAGNVIGSAIFGTLAFVIACLAGLSAATVIFALLVTLAAAAVFRDPQRRLHLKRDWEKAKGKLQGINTTKALTFCYYAFFVVVLWLFFERTMIEMPDGIYTGGSHNLGDLPFHLGVIFGFADGGNFPPQNPSFAGAKFSYPFISDVITAAFMELGAGVREAMFVQDFAWAFSLLVILDRFVVKLTGERYAGKIAVALLFFSGGLGFVSFLSDTGSKGLFDSLWHLKTDYTMNDQGYSWGNSLMVLFMTQRSLLMGMPLTIVVTTYLWNVFIGPRSLSTSSGIEDQKPKTKDQSPGFKSGIVNAFIVGLIAGLLPLIHLHSLAVLFVVTAFLLVIDAKQWRLWIAFGIGVCVTAIPELAWSLAGSASKASEFIGWHFGWDAKDENVLSFWARNTGLLIPLILAGIGLLVWGKQKEEANGRKILLFYIPFAALFFIANIVKLAPWEWDNIKVLIYWFVGSLPLVSLVLIWAWRQGIGGRIAAGACLAVLIASGSLDVWRTVSGQINYKVFDKDAEQIAEQIKAKTPPNALFVNAPTYNSAVVLSGRESLIRFPGHIWSHGIDAGTREQDVKAIYAGGPQADDLLKRYNVDYVIVSPLEKGSLTVNDGYFQKFPVAAATAGSKVYKVK